MDREMRFDSGASWFGARKDRIAEADSLLLHAVEQAARPDEFGGQDAQRQHNREPTGAGRDDHQDSQSEQGEPEENLQEALRLL
jgi:hypothetical protein